MDTTYAYDYEETVDIQPDFEQFMSVDNNCGYVEGEYNTDDNYEDVFAEIDDQPVEYWAGYYGA